MSYRHFGFGRVGDQSCRSAAASSLLAIRYSTKMMLVVAFMALLSVPFADAQQEVALAHNDYDYFFMLYDQEWFMDNQRKKILKELLRLMLRDPKNLISVKWCLPPLEKAVHFNSKNDPKQYYQLIDETKPSRPVNEAKDGLKKCFEEVGDKKIFEHNGGRKDRARLALVFINQYFDEKYDWNSTLMQNVNMECKLLFAAYRKIPKIFGDQDPVFMYRDSSDLQNLAVSNLSPYVTYYDCVIEAHQIGSPKPVENGTCMCNFNWTITQRATYIGKACDRQPGIYTENCTCPTTSTQEVSTQEASTRAALTPKGLTPDARNESELGKPELKNKTTVYIAVGVVLFLVIALIILVVFIVIRRKRRQGKASETKKPASSNAAKKSGKKAIGSKSIGKKSIGKKSIGKKSIGKKSIGKKSAAPKSSPTSQSRSSAKKSILKSSKGPGRQATTSSDL